MKLTNSVARWETRGKDWLELFRGEQPNDYFYRGNSCGGGFNAADDAAAIARMENGHGQAAILKMDRPSLRRVA